MVTALLWKWFYDPGAGLANETLRFLHLPTSNWSNGTDTALISLVIVATWANLGGTVLIYLAALQSIPGELYEAAELDGASLLQRVRYVTIPQTRFVILMLMLLQIIATMQVFTEPFVITGGGPESATVTVLYLIYKYAFLYNDFGGACALSVMLLVLLGVFSALYLRLTRSERTTCDHPHAALPGDPRPAARKGRLLDGVHRRRRALRARLPLPRLLDGHRRHEVAGRDRADPAHDHPQALAPQRLHRRLVPDAAPGAPVEHGRPCRRRLGVPAGPLHGRRLRPVQTQARLRQVDPRRHPGDADGPGPGTRRTQVPDRRRPPVDPHQPAQQPLGIWLPAVANAFNLYLLKRFFDQLPRDVMEAAEIDGAGKLRILWSIVLPMSRPVLGVVSIFALVAVWQDFLWPLMVFSDTDKQPISVALVQLSQNIQLTVLIAAMVIASIPMVAMFLVFQRHIIAGISAGSTKG